MPPQTPHPADKLTVLSYPIDDSTPAESGNVRWHQVAVEGNWDGHWQGPFALDESTFNSIIAHQKSRGVDAVVDYEHATSSFFAPPDTPAAGWATDFQTRATADGLGLFARIAWTDKAAEMIRAREKRYLSPTIWWNTRDRKTGASLGPSMPAIALTNTPFLEELPEISLATARALLSSMHDRLGRSQETASMLTQEQLQSLATTLGLTGSVTPDALLSAAGKVRGDAQLVDRICLALGIAEGTAGEAIVHAAQTIKGRLEAAPSPEELEKLKSELAGAKTEMLLASARTTGKIVASNEAFAKKLAGADPQMFAEWLESAPAVVPLQHKSPPAAPPAGGTSDDPRTLAAAVAALSPEDRSVAQQLGLSLEQYVKHNPALMSASLS